MTVFPPQDIRAFLELCVGDWLSLRSLLEPEGDEGWHASERGELRVEFVAPVQLENCGALTIHLPDKGRIQMEFLADHTVLINTAPGRWELRGDGCLDLEVNEESRTVKERIWFSKPNLRLRCTLEEFRNGGPGRASFSSEIRRLQRPT